MKIAVWDLYIKKVNGNVLHFNVVVHESKSKMEIVFNYANEYLKSIGVDSAEINVKNCQFCHIENLTDNMKSDIETSGYHIIEMDEIPSILSDNPTRREMILFLRAHFDKYRFADFRYKNDIEIKKIIHELNSRKKL